MSEPAPPALPDLLRFDDGLRLERPQQWEARRLEVSAHILPTAYGPLPPTPALTRCEVRHVARVASLGGAPLLSCWVSPAGANGFSMRVFLPPGPASGCPVLLNGDGCWHYASDAVIAAVLRRGTAFAQFNRVDIAADMPGRSASDSPYAALACWAWGYHRAIDALLAADGQIGPLGQIDPQRIAVVGHSRGGKAALLAGATDTRIALTSANNSGAGGAACWRWGNPGAETLADITGAFPHWFAPGLAAYAQRVHELPFDQHFLKALIAPRALLTTEALGDAWANPQGSALTHRATQPLYALLGQPEQLALVNRAGDHSHSPVDWYTLLDFIDLIFFGRPSQIEPDLDQDHSTKTIVTLP